MLYVSNFKRFNIMYSMTSSSGKVGYILQDFGKLRFNFTHYLYLIHNTNASSYIDIFYIGDQLSLLSGITYNDSFSFTIAVFVQLIFKGFVIMVQGFWSAAKRCVFSWKSSGSIHSLCGALSVSMGMEYYRIYMVHQCTQMCMCVILVCCNQQL